MKPKILSWNVRGLNEGDKRLRVRNLLRQWKADIICLQETKLEFISNNLVRSLWGCPFVDWCYLASCGASGGMLIMWDKRIVEKIDVFVGELVLAFFFRSVDDDFSWAFAGIYGPNIDALRSSFWDELAGLSSWWELPWCIGGDFNVTRFLVERSRDVRLNAAMMEFSNFISVQGLMDLPLAEGSFMRSNNQENPSWSRLDRFLVSPDWEVKFPGTLQKRLPRLCSDHFPILLDCGGIHWSPRPFKFENMWLKAEGFVERVRLWWTSYHFQGSPSFIFSQKLKALKIDLKRWNEKEFGNVEVHKNMLMEDLCALDRLEEQHSLAPEEKIRKCEVIKDLENSIL